MTATSDNDRPSTAPVGPSTDAAGEGPFHRLHAAFTAHPASVGESYGAHCRFALGFAGRLALAAGAAAVHAVLPFLFEKTASRMIGEMHDRLHRR
jgi:hypothetical protein